MDIISEHAGAGPPQRREGLVATVLEGGGLSRQWIIM